MRVHNIDSRGNRNKLANAFCAKLVLIYSNVLVSFPFRCLHYALSLILCMLFNKKVISVEQPSKLSFLPIMSAAS